MLTQAIETGNLEELVDPRLERNFNEAEMFRMIEAAAACVRYSASRRPRMSQVHIIYKLRLEFVWKHFIFLHELGTMLCIPICAYE